MHTVNRPGRVAVAVFLAIVILDELGVGAASAATPAKTTPPIAVHGGGRGGGTVGTKVRSPGHGGHTGTGLGKTGSGSSPGGSNPCASDPTSVACEAYSPAAYCRAVVAEKKAALAVGACAETGLGVATVTPAQLAVTAQNTLVLPKPSVSRSPDQTLRYDGSPYTYVNLWTWYWASPASYRTLTQTTRAGAVWATVTARPVSLSFDPGNGDPAVSCAGPGRAWTHADGNHDPTASGACGYRYVASTDDTPITVTVTTTWDVSWVGSGGTSALSARSAPPRRGRCGSFRFRW